VWYDLCMKKEMKVLVRAAEREGWLVKRTKRGHYQWLPPQGRVIVTAGTPSDHRALRNIKSDLRREGLCV